MLSKKNRLTRAEFSHYFTGGKRFHSPLFTLVYSPEKFFKASAVISKKIAKSAVDRNRFRRRVYAAFEAALREKPIHGIFICIAKQGSTAASVKALREELFPMIHKTSVLG